MIDACSCVRASGFDFTVVCDFDAATAGGAAVVWRVRPHLSAKKDGGGTIELCVFHW